MERDRRNGLAGILRLNRSPFPSVSSYICISLLISGIAIGSIINNFRTQPEIKLLLQEEIRNGSLNQSYDAKSLEYLSSLTVVQVVQYIMGNSPLIWVSPLSGAARERLSWLCFFLFVFSTVMMIGVIRIHKYLNISHLLFLIVDSSLSFVRSLHGLLRCLSASDRFARRPDFVRHCSYWLDLTVALITDTIQLFNYIHLMFLSPLGFNITCFFFFYHIKNAYGSIMNTLMRHHKHNQIFLHIRSTYPSGKAEEGDLCIVCWELLGNRMVQEMFPQMALDVIIDDLRISGSTQATIENILEGRVGFLTGLPGEEVNSCCFNYIILVIEFLTSVSYRRYIESDKGRDLQEKGY
uniref:CUE domain-containing protein n=1 Tax=Heterorhabditis bacteriophora TaxID=37862 RepID=A0A1I7XR11_HETBA